MFNNVLRNCKVHRSLAATAAGSTNVNGTTIDSEGATSIVHKLGVGTLTATQVTSLQAQSGDASDGSDMADITGASVTFADADSGKVALVEVFKPTKRYHRLQAKRATANAVLDFGLTELYFNRTGPDTQNGTLIAGSAIKQAT